jgi:IclR family acetate operon transcriptional repressor
MAEAPRLRGRPKTDPEKADTNTVQALDRAMRLLEVIAATPGKTLSELAVITDQAVATVFRALVTLQARGMVEAEEPGQFWHIGSGAFRVGNAFLRRSNVVERARPAMDELRRATGETVALGIEVADELLILAQSETHQPIRAYFPPGTIAPMHVSGGGKALLAWLDEDRVQEVLDRKGMARATSLSLSSADSLRRDLSRTRERGFSLDDQEQAEGMRGVAAPIFNAFAEPVAAILVAGPAFRMGLSDSTRFGAWVRAAADRVTDATGGVCP